MTLRDLGFTPEQETAYRLLLADPARSAAELVPGPAARQRTVLAGLVALGVARPRADRPCGLEPLEPSVALGGLIERSEDALLEQQRRVGGARAHLPGLAALFHGSDGALPLDGIEEIEDLPGVRERLAELSFFTRRSVYSVQPSGSGAPAAAAAARPSERRRGLDVRVIYPAEVAAQEHVEAWLRLRREAGTAVRLSSRPLDRMIILDEEVAVLPRDRASGHCGALIVRQPGVLRPLLQLFTHLWDAAQELGPARDGNRADAELDAADRTVLRLLAQGATDEKVARELGLSVRHSRRRVARLMHRLDAGSRFAAGAAAAHRGWI